MENDEVIIIEKDPSAFKESSGCTTLNEADPDIFLSLDPQKVGSVEAPPNGDDGDHQEGGRGWWVILGCFILSAITLSWGLVWGAFQEYYKYNILPDTSDSMLSLLGSTQNVVSAFASFVAGKLGDRFGYKRFIAIGSALSFLGMFSAAFCTKLWQFFLTQGVLPGVANGILFPMIAAYPSQWFNRKRSLTSGIVIAGGSFGGGVSSLIMRVMLSSLGLRKTLLIYSFAHLLLMIICYLLIRSPKRFLLNPPRHKIAWIDRECFKKLSFWTLGIGLFFACFGYFPPYYLLPTYIREKYPTISPSMGTAPVAAMNFSAVVGRTLIGFTADRIGPTNSLILAVGCSGLSQLLIWNFASSYGVIVAFCVIYGFFGGCFISLLAPVAGRNFGLAKLATLCGLLSLFNAPGYIAGAPVGGAIHQASKGNWRPTIIYSGAIQIVGVLFILHARFKGDRRLWASF